MTMPKSTRALVAICSLVVGALLVARPASANQLRIALMEIEGTRADGLQLDLADVMRSVGHKIIKSKVYRKTAKRLRAKKLNAADVRKVCDFLSIDAVMFGTLHPERGKYTFRIRIREGATGRLVDTVTLRIRDKKLSKGVARQLRRRLIRVLDEVQPIHSRGRRTRVVTQDEEEEEVKKPRRRPVRIIEDDEEEDEVAPDEGEGELVSTGVEALEEEELEDEELEGEGEADDEDDEEEEEEVAEDEAPDDVAPRSRDRVIRGGPFRVFAGFSAVSRRLTFNAASGLTAEQAPQEYRGGVVPGFYLSGEVYPMAFSRDSDSALRNLGIGFVLDRVLKVESTVASGDMEVSRPTTQMRWGVDLRYRFNFGDDPTDPSLFVSAGYSVQSFEIDRGDVAMSELEIPNTEYSWVDPRIGLRLPFTERTGIFASVAGLFVLKAGDITAGDNYGEARILGLDGDLFFEVRATDNVVITIGGHATGLGFDFRGTGDLTDRDGDPETEDVGGAMDLTLTGFAMVGFNY